MEIDSMEGENRLPRLSPDEVSLEFHVTATRQNDFQSIQESEWKLVKPI